MNRAGAATARMPYDDAERNQRRQVCWSQRGDADTHEYQAVHAGVPSAIDMHYGGVKYVHRAHHEEYGSRSGPPYVGDSKNHHTAGRDAVPHTSQRHPPPPDDPTGDESDCGAEKRRDQVEAAEVRWPWRESSPTR